MTRLLLAATIVLTALFGQPLQAQDEPFRFDEIKHQLRIGADPSKLIEEIRENGLEPLSLGQLEELKKLGAGPQLLAQLRGSLKKSGGDLVSEVIRRSKSSGKAELIRWIMRQGRSLRLTRTQMRQMREASLDIELQKALAGSFVFEGFRTYRDPMGMLAVQHPKSWRAFEWSTATSFRVLITPDDRPEHFDHFETGLQIEVRANRVAASIRQRGLLALHQQRLPGMVRKASRSRLQPTTSAGSNKLAGNDAVEQQFQLQHNGAAASQLFVRTVAKDLDYRFRFTTPTKRSAAAAQIRDSILASFRPTPGRVEPRRRGKAMRPSDVVQRHRQAVVKVIAHGLGSGSGFIVRDDGLVLTNAHVIRDKNNPKGPTVAKSISVELQVEGGRRKVKAELLDWIYKHKPRIDIALLRLPRTRNGYPTIPVSSARSSRIQIGDPIIALGFPGLGKGEMFMTQGSLTAIKYDNWRVRGRTHRRLDQITTSATIAPGNSGGPCIDLRTGGVIGLNTFVFGESLSAYSGVSAIDHALSRFPQIRWYPKGRRMTAEQLLLLGGILRESGKLRSAQLELKKAFARKADLTSEQVAEVHWQTALLQQELGNRWSQTSSELACLKADPNHLDAALAQVGSLRMRRKYAQALETLDRLAKVHGSDFRIPVARARVFAGAKRLPEALAALKRAEQIAGSNEPLVHIARGDVWASEFKVKQALAAYRQAQASDPYSIEAHLALANHLQLAGDRSTAAIEYQKLLNQYPDSAVAHAARAKFYSLSKDAKERARGVDDALNAVFLEWKSGRSGASYLAQAANQSIVTGQTRQAQLLAMLLHGHGGSHAVGAHRVLANVWKRKGNKELQALHQRRGLFQSTLVTTAMTRAMIAAGYTPSLLQDVLRKASLSFRVDATLLAEIKKLSGYQVGHLRGLLWRTKRDQMSPSPSLGAAGQVRFKGKINLGKVRPTATITVTNRAGVPLSALRVRRTYYDANKKVLWRSFANLAMGTSRTLDPGKTRTFFVLFDDWKTLEKRKIRNKIKSYGLGVASARNGTYLQAIQLKTVIEKGILRVKITNNSLFRLRKVEMACEYVTSGKSPQKIRGRNFLPFAPRAKIDKLNLDRGKNATYRVNGWPVSVPALRKKGAIVPKGKSVRAVARLEDVILQG